MTQLPRNDDRLHSSGIATGVVIYRGRAFAVSLSANYLVFDLKSWAKDIQVKNEEIADLCMRENRANTAAEYRKEAAFLQAWAERGDMSQPILGHGALRERQQIMPCQVTCAELGDYIVEVLRQSRVPDASDPYMFLLLADAPSPTLYTTKRLTYAAQHTGHEIRGEVVLQADLNDKILVARRNADELARRIKMERARAAKARKVNQEGATVS